MAKYDDDLDEILNMKPGNLEENLKVKVVDDRDKRSPAISKQPSTEVGKKKAEHLEDNFMAESEKKKID